MTDELRDLTADLNKAAVKAFPAVAAAVAKGAHNVKEQMAEEAQSSGSYRHFHRSIGYDLNKGGLEAEIGPDKNGPQGALGNLLYFGSSKNAPVLDVESALRDEAPRFEKAIGDIGIPGL